MYSTTISQVLISELSSQFFKHQFLAAVSIKNEDN